MPITYQIAQHGFEDFNHLDAILALTAQVEQRNAAPYLYPPNRDFFIRTLGTNCASIFAYADDQLVGFSVLKFLRQWPDYLFETGPCKHAAMMLFSLVHPDYRGQGISKHMAQLRVGIAKQAGVKCLFSTVHPNNSASLQTLRSLGFVAIDERVMFEEQLLRKVMMLNGYKP